MLSFKAAIGLATATVFVALLGSQPVNAGKILFFMPVIAKSTKITWYPLAKELADRGHEVTIVNPEYGHLYPSIREFVIPRTFFNDYTRYLSKTVDP